MPTTADLPVLPAIVEGAVMHNRQGPIEHSFEHRVYQWLIDLDHIPRPPWYLRPFAGFDARDHLGGTQPGASPEIKKNIERFLAGRGIRLRAGERVLMLANARVLGHVFNPLTVYWCLAVDGTPTRVIAEVHNTHGERHAYVLTPDSDGAASVAKDFYVSPFNDVSGRYGMTFTVTDRQVSVAVSLQREGRPEFRAAFTGVPTPATSRTIARYALWMPAMPHKVSTLIRFHGILLWLRRLPVIDHPRHIPQEGV
ncbi:MAG TPA: DUF1365 domain-containing protein [Ilumatobacteraceae bacterium]|nr:DUF1365 domain-containing protein [Ilumatobacteraceae bacterium]